MAGRKKRVVDGASFSKKSPVAITSKTIYRSCTFVDDRMDDAMSGAMSGHRDTITPNVVDGVKTKPATDVVFEDCTFFGHVFHHVALEDSTFRGCSFRGPAQPMRTRWAIFFDGSLERVTFEACLFETIRVVTRARGIKFLGCRFGTHATVDIHDMAGVMWDDSKMGADLFRLMVPANYDHQPGRDGVVVAAKGVTEAGERATYRIGNEFLKKLMLTKRWGKEALPIDGLVFDSLDLSGVNFSGVSFLGCGFRRCDLSGASRLVSIASNFGECDMRGLANSSFREARIVQCNLRGATFYGWMMASSDVSRSDFRDARMIKSDLRATTFTACTFADASLRDALLAGTRGTLDGADLEGAYAKDTDRAFLRTITGPMANGKPWDHRLPRPTWDVEDSRVVRVWSRAK